MLIRIIISAFQFLLGVMMAGFVIYYTYRAFIKANPDFNMEEEIKKGNIAVGILLSCVVLIASTYVGNGIDAMSKALVPQPSIGQIEIME